MIAVPVKEAEDVDARVQFQFLQGLADGMPEAVLIGVPCESGGAGTIIYANEAATDRLDCTFEALLGQPSPALSGRSSFPRGSQKDLPATDRFRSSRFSVLWARSPAERTGDWRVALFRDANGEPRYSLYVLAEPA